MIFTLMRSPDLIRLLASIRLLDRPTVIQFDANHLQLKTQRKFSFHSLERELCWSMCSSSDISATIAFRGWLRSVALVEIHAENIEDQNVANNRIDDRKL
jgi:hypothetical protein